MATKVTKHYHEEELPLREIVIEGGNRVGVVPPNRLVGQLRGDQVHLSISTSDVGPDFTTFNTTTFGIFLDRDAALALRGAIDNFLKQT